MIWTLVDMRLPSAVVVDPAETCAGEQLIVAVKLESTMLFHVAVSERVGSPRATSGIGARLGRTPIPLRQLSREVTGSPREFLPKIASAVPRPHSVRLCRAR
jgi:hypothetical protein